jgi:hypothetical protein
MDFEEFLAEDGARHANVRQRFCEEMQREKHSHQKQHLLRCKHGLLLDPNI